MRQQPIDPLLYARVFSTHPEGQEIFKELRAIFYDTQSFKSDPYETAFNEGKRAVLSFILNKIASANQQQEEE